MCVQVVLLAELVRDGDAGEVLAPVALHGVDVEEDGEGGEETQEDQQEDADLDTLAVHVGLPKAGEEKHALFVSVRESKTHKTNWIQLHCHCTEYKW